jgi:hypothetical protein
VIDRPSYVIRHLLTGCIPQDSIYQHVESPTTGFTNGAHATLFAPHQYQYLAPQSQQEFSAHRDSFSLTSFPPVVHASLSEHPQNDAHTWQTLTHPTYFHSVQQQVEASVPGTPQLLSPPEEYFGAEIHIPQQPRSSSYPYQQQQQSMPQYSPRVHHVSNGNLQYYVAGTPTPISPFSSSSDTPHESPLKSALALDGSQRAHKLPLRPADLLATHQTNQNFHQHQLNPSLRYISQQRTVPP